MASGWNLWVWLQCIGVLVGSVVRRYIDILTININFLYSTCISSFLASASLLLCSFFKCFFGLVIIILYIFNNYYCVFGFYIGYLYILFAQ